MTVKMYPGDIWSALEAAEARRSKPLADSSGKFQATVSTLTAFSRYPGDHQN